MDSRKHIPIHDFSTDDETSVPFRYLPLELKDDHDPSVPHRHNYYEVFIFLKGGGKHVIDFREYPVEANSLHFVSPGQVHKLQRTPGSFGHIIFFSRDFFMVAPQQEELLTALPFLNNNGGDPVLKLTPAEMNSLQPIFAALQQESTRGKVYSADIARSYLSILLLECQRKIPAQTEDTLTGNSRLCRDFRVLLEKNFRSRHQVQDYAQMLNTTPKTLNETLRLTTGNTASGHIYDRLILEAKRLLKHSQLSVKEIAWFLNYEDPAHFSKFFKTHTGLSPADFREQ